MNRRHFLTTSLATLALPAFAESAELQADVVICGGSLGGVAATLAAARNGLRVVLTEETDWIGGQLTNQAVPPDEHPWIEQFGCTASYRNFRNLVRDYYKNQYPVTAEARAQRYLNPGNGSVSKLCHEPKVALAVLEGMLAPFVSNRQVQILLEHRLVRADVQGDLIRSVCLRDVKNGKERILSAPYFIDATELGDLLPLSKTEYLIGFESQKQTQEPHAPAEAQPSNQQAFTFCFAMDYLEGEDHTIEKPADYAFWKDYVPQMKPAWPDKLLSWNMSNPTTLGRREVSFDPSGAVTKGMNLWTYRRIIDRKQFSTGAFRGDISLVNWPQNDYWLGNLVDLPEAEIQKHLKRGKELSLALLYWLQTEAPRSDGKQGWPGLRLREDLVGTQDGLAKYPYIRESRRIQALFTVLEQHVGTEARIKWTGKTKEEVTAEPFRDSVGIGSYRIDLHPSTGGDNYIDVSSLPFQIPLGALIPQRVENLIASCKNIGTTHITNGCYRLHPVEWNIGEAAGVLIAKALDAKVRPAQIRKNPKLLAELQTRLQNQGVELNWPRLTAR
ncbi:FAD-dependent oxidoreductase [Telmatocola sphagniphila]|uniref:FAD-dependent oxidoreductase n=1 Tax=Telmatocola sphagniphila TaxID=1123043 RepID=A0A8E6EWD9_9BACT|nr:FAD-dependent oxidoreductase [Telmatocola sphagniphila]QVL33697.1 FAD-dependent oxidoreductase [Telmatocola sphagniphila]